MYMHMTGAQEHLCKLHRSGTLYSTDLHTVVWRKSKVISAKPSLFQIFLMVCQLKCESLQILDSRLTILAM